MSKIFVKGTGKSFEVGKILCLGRNYAAHAKEMNATLTGFPVVFMKPATALIHSGEQVILPRISSDVHHEVEMVIVIGTRAKNVSIEQANEHIGGFAVGLDMTLRDVQNDAKKKGLPWTVSKGFDTSAPVSDAVEKQEVSDPHALFIALKVNGETRQKSNTGAMLYKSDYLVSYLSSIFTLEPGDLIFTGTPEGVGPVHDGDILEAELQSVGTLQVSVVNESNQ